MYRPRHRRERRLVRRELADWLARLSARCGGWGTPPARVRLTA